MRSRSHDAAPWVILALLTIMGAAPPRQPATTAPSTPPHVSSLRNEPGYVPLVDPESASVTLGRRLNAPAVSQPFRGGAPGLEPLGRAICERLEQGQTDRLLELCVTDAEFRDVMWREFPQSRPAVGLTWVDAWRVLYARLHAGCSHAMRDFTGHHYTFTRFETGETPVRYRNFTLHNRLVLVARDEAGTLVRMRWLRSVAERRGVFKIYSTDD